MLLNFNVALLHAWLLVGFLTSEHSAFLIVGIVLACIAVLVPDGPRRRFR